MTDEDRPPPNWVEFAQKYSIIIPNFLATMTGALLYLCLPKNFLLLMHNLAIDHLGYAFVPVLIFAGLFSAFFGHYSVSFWRRFVPC